MQIHLDHLTINVRDMEASERFYGEILGLPKMENVDMGDHEIHYFQLNGPIRLELIRYMDDFGELKPNVKTRGIYRHFAMETEDVDALFEKIRTAGYTCLTEPNDVENLRFRGFLVEDPNGVEVEFIQRWKK